MNFKVINGINITWLQSYVPLFWYDIYSGDKFQIDDANITLTS